AFDPSESSRSPVTCLSSDAKRNTPADLLSAWLIKTLGSVAMPGYSHLLDEERDQIAALKAAGHSIGAIEGGGAGQIHRVAGVAPKRLAQWPLFAALRFRSLSTAQTA